MTLLQSIRVYVILLWLGNKTQLLRRAVAAAATATTTTTTTSTTANGNPCQPLTLRMPAQVRNTRPTTTHRHLTIAHRGASAHLPEHTLAGYRLALELGADFIEPDLVVTADEQLLALHTMDLHATTDVATKFPHRQAWFSPWANTSGYWVFNFTADEIATLRVRQGVTNVGRSTAYDGVFGVPTLTDIVQLMQEWNTVDLPQRLPVNDDDDKDENAVAVNGGPVKPNNLQLAQAGIYAELKDALWLQQEAGINIVDLLLKHLQQNADAWEILMPCFDEMQYDAYKVPGLVVQSFDVQALQELKQKWAAQQPLLPNVPEPPYVLLVDKDQCQDQEFWFKVGDTSREMLSGIGCDKSCLIAKEPYTLTTTKAEEYNLEIHAWTERPEQTFVNDRFTSELEEIKYLYCHVGIQGVFSESVSTAVTAAMLPCDNQKGGKHHNGKQPNTQSENDEESPQQYCYNSADEAGFFTAMAAFVMGTFITSLFFIGYGRHYIRWQSTVVPSADEGIVVANSRGGMTQLNHRELNESSSHAHHGHEWHETAAAVDEWRSTQLAAAAAVDEDHHGLEMT